MSSNIGDNDSIPFHSLSDDEFMPLTQHTCLNSSGMDRLNQLKFDPFQANSKIALSQNNEKLDSLYDISKVDCNYYLPDEFKKHLSVTKQKSKSFSLLHLNIFIIYLFIYQLYWTNIVETFTSLSPKG